MKKAKVIITLAKVPLDILAAFLAWILAWKVRPITDLIPFLYSYFDPRFLPDYNFVLHLALWSAPFFALTASFFAAYQIKKVEKELWRLIITSIFWSMSIVAFFSFAWREPIFSRMMLIQATLFTVLLASFFRFLLYLLEKYLLKTGLLTSQVFLFASSQKANMIKAELELLPEFVLTEDKKLADEIWLLDNSADVEEIENYCYNHHKTLRFAQNSPLLFAKIENIFVGKEILLTPIFYNISYPERILKRLADIILSFLIIVLLLPFFLIIIFAIKIDSAGPIFYRQKRVGKAGQEFWIFKFRSMVKNADKLKKNLAKKNHRQDGPFFKIKDDPRITRFGKFLRKYSLDEFPQLFNVIKGEMSLVGPRPHLPEEIKKFSLELKRILSIKPGLTGLAQISGRSDLLFEEEIKFDLYYLENFSLLLDLKIFIKTIGHVFLGKGD